MEAEMNSEHHDKSVPGGRDFGEASRFVTAHPIERVLSVAWEALEMDVAFVTEVVGDRLEFRAKEGDAESFGLETGDSIPLEESYCKRIIDGRLPSAIPDTGADERTSDLEMTRKAGIGAYAGFPFRLSDGSVYGTLCCLSHSPDPWLRDRDLQLMGKLALGLAARLEREGFL